VRQTVETEHIFEMRERRGEWLCWRPASESLYDAARKLAHFGRAEEAINCAYDIEVKTYGHTHHTRFRVRTVTTTITAQGPWEDCLPQ